ncbi:nicotinamide riboside transporter PnuC [Acetobacter indonesiensis]|uniref:nicotinamide riboside transporter PnuC n=1 Tax=Acetobacter indonesiensis TaxID=104101 RepID=UPI001F017B95|nr:nicotinamide riboside transporter PnuC [Acetobacter indonesiensis]MCG0994694.1 nicotinamide riboside transporter PnuC [Acetobacter indonesiensis]
MSPLEIAAVLFSAFGVWLTGRRTMLCWPVMVIASVLYGVVFWQARLYADMALQGVFAALSLYGWARWLRGMVQDGAITIRPLSAVGFWSGLGAGAVGGVALGVLLRTTTDDPMPMLDAALSAYSILGQVWMARRYLACWWVWCAVDVLYTGLFLVRGLYLTAGLYAAFVALAVMGFQQWRKAAARS